MPQNGETNRRFGIYKTVCCGAEIVINLGATFPDCPNHRKLSTIWKYVIDEKNPAAAANKSQPDPPVELHVENRRLFNLAVGRLVLEPWEEKHLHGCTVCQGVLHVLLRQKIAIPAKNPPKSSDAA
jgi:hypothetical protein